MLVQNVNVGSCEGVNYKDTQITFPEPFPAPSGETASVIVVATVVLDTQNYPLDKYNDTYTVSVANVTNKGFVARVRRCAVDDRTGWGMNLTLNYCAEALPV